MAADAQGRIQTATRMLSQISQTLESSDDAAQRVQHVLNEIRRLVPSDRCAILAGAAPGEPAFYFDPPGPADAEALRSLLTGLRASIVGGEEENGKLPVQGPGERPHLALPLVGLDRVVGVVFVEREEPGYDDEDLGLLTIVAAQLAAYLVSLELQAVAARGVDALRRANEFQQVLMAAVGHDLRSPLSAMVIAAESLGYGATDGRQVKSVERIKKSGKRAARIISDLLDASLVRQQGRLQITPESADLVEIVEEAVAEVRLAYPECPVEIDAPKKMPGLWDPGRLSQVFTNLLRNATEYTEPGRPVRVTLQRGEAGVIGAVHNYGTVLFSEDVAHLFEPFKRGTQDSRITRTPGLGLGLFIVREIVTAHGGTVRVESAAGAGTTFRLELPWTVPAPSRRPEARGGERISGAAQP